MSSSIVKVRRLTKSDDRSSFSSGNIDLDRFFQRFAGQNQFRHYVGVTYVAEEEDEILGYVTVAGSSIEVEDLSVEQRKGLPNYPLPALRIARLAASVAHQSQGVGKLLLKHCLVMAKEMAERSGCVGVVVDAKQDAVSFYEKYGFKELDVVAGQLGDRPAPTCMFLPIGSIPK